MEGLYAPLCASLDTTRTESIIVQQLQSLNIPIGLATSQ